MCQFYDEGGGEAGMSADFSPSCFDQPVIDADQLVLNSRYSGAADYLLNWRPEYQPLADVFAEIARLPDDSEKRSPRSRPGAVAKTCPTHIVPQPAAVNHRLGSASAAHRPPPIITSAPPRAIRVAKATDNDSVTSSVRSSTSSNQQREQQQVPSAWTNQPASFRSRDLTCSASQNSPQHPPATNRRDSSRSSDREIQI